MSITKVDKKWQKYAEDMSKIAAEIKYEYPWETGIRQIVKNDTAIKELESAAGEYTFFGRELAFNETGTLKAVPKRNVFKQNYPNLWKDLTENAYPYNVQPHVLWMKYMKTGMWFCLHEDEGCGIDYQGLWGSRADWEEYHGHDGSKNTDELGYNIGQHGIWIVTSVLAKITEDFEGGRTVIGNDYTMMNDYIVRQKLEVHHAKEVGQGMSWSEFTKHGITEIEKGERVTLMIAKKIEDFDVTKWEKGPIDSFASEAAWRKQYDKWLELQKMTDSYKTYNPRPESDEK